MIFKKIIQLTLIYLTFSSAEMSAVRFGRRNIIDLNWRRRDDKRW